MIYCPLPQGCKLAFVQGDCNFLSFNAWKLITPIFLRVWLNCPIFDKMCINNLLFQTAAVKEKQKQIGNKKVQATEGYRNTVNE